MSQLNFFMTKEEMRVRLDDLLASGLVTLFFGHFFDSRKPTPIWKFTETQEFDKIVIWVNNDIIEPQCSSLGQGDYKGKHLFDFYKDPIIELDNCRFAEKMISPGRLFYKTGYIENESVRQLHTKVASKIARLFGKDLIQVAESFKMSRQVKALIDQGFQIELGQGGLVIDKSSINST